MGEQADYSHEINEHLIYRYGELRYVPAVSVSRLLVSPFTLSLDDNIVILCRDFSTKLRVPNLKTTLLFNKISPTIITRISQTTCSKTNV